MATATMRSESPSRLPRMPTGYDEVGPESHNLSFLLTLLTMLDFEEPGSVKKEDWERGVAALHAPGLSWEVSWQTLLNRFDLDFNGSIDFGEMHGLAPLDPRLASLLRVVVQTLVRLSERINGAYAGIKETKLKMMRGTINQWKDAAKSKTFLAWRDDVRKTAERRAVVLANFKYAPCRKCLHAMHGMLSARKASMKRAAIMIAGGEAALKQRVLTAWRDAHFNERESRKGRLSMYFMSREDFWKTHVVQTWMLFTRHEKVVRRFVMRWMFQGMAKTYIAWQRHVRHALADRNRGLAKGMAMFTGGTRCAPSAPGTPLPTPPPTRARPPPPVPPASSPLAPWRTWRSYKCFQAWVQMAAEQIAERDARLREQLMRKGAMLGTRVVRAWFEWNTVRREAKRVVGWKVSAAGCAFRAWYMIIDEKRRHEFLTWALGPDMVILTNKVKAATANIREELSSQVHGRARRLPLHRSSLALPPPPPSIVHRRCLLPARLPFLSPSPSTLAPRLSAPASLEPLIRLTGAVARRPSRCVRSWACTRASCGTRRRWSASRCAMRWRPRWT